MKMISYAMVETLIKRVTKQPLYIYIYTYIAGTFYIKEDRYSYFYIQETLEDDINLQCYVHLGPDS